jgi:hypothetical protein
MSKLEQRCRLLLTVYPAEYRGERGEEILGTLLDAMPPDRGWPPARDVWELLIGGLRARAAANRRLSTASAIRLGVLLGIAIELSLSAAGFLRDFVTSSAVFATARDTAASGERELVAGLLIAAAVTCAWRGRRRLLLACVPAAAAAVIWLLIHQPAYASQGYTLTTLSVGAAASLLLCLAALIPLAGQGERPTRSGSWLIGLLVATEVLGGIMPSRLFVLSLLGSALIVVIAWIAVDARPALGLATFLVLEVVTILGDTVRLGKTNQTPIIAQMVAIWPVYALLLVVGGLALWRLRRRQAVD